PSDVEWTQLIDYLGGDEAAGGKLKETGTAHWDSPNEGATNETGFTALPGGARGYDGTFYTVGGSSHWWSATEIDANDAWSWDVYSYGSGLGGYGGSKEFGYSVRCVRN
ncbi:MAG TPA: FISUMP domain-containing protein, partial [Atopostipes sp.]|nr:FISUMP domain-containing protein [Atopostipes sp.]